MEARPLEGATVVFDLDGTLVDTAPDLTASLNSLLADEGLGSIAPTIARGFIGQGARAFLARGFEARGRPLDEAALAERYRRFEAHYLGRIARESRPFPGVAEALEVLSAAGARLAVCTNKPELLARALLSAFDMLEIFDAVVGPESVKAPKPDPAHLWAAVERAGGRSDRAVMVGDSEADAAVARRARVPLALVTFGYGEEHPIVFAPDLLIVDFKSLPSAVFTLLGRRPKVIGASPAKDA